MKQIWRCCLIRCISKWQNQRLHKERGSSSYVLLVITMLLLGMWQTVGSSITGTTQVIKEEIDNIGTMYGSERGLTWLLAYVKQGGSLHFTELVIPDSPVYELRIKQVHDEYGRSVFRILCYHRGNHRSSERRVRLTTTEVNGKIQVIVHELYTG